MTTVAFNLTSRHPLFIDAGPLFEQHVTGIGRFVARLIEAVSRKTEVRLFGGKLSGEIEILPGSFADVDDDLGRVVRDVMRRPHLPRDQLTERRATGLYTALRPAFRRFRKELGVLYDFTSLLLPWCHNLETRQHFANFFGQTTSFCDRFLAISQSTKHDSKWLSACDREVVVSYPGPSMCVRRHASGRSVERRNDVLLIVSTLEPRKNGLFLLDWFERTNLLSASAELWWVGPSGWWTPKAMTRQLLGRQSRKARCIKFLGMVPEERLCMLYRQAAATVYPSLYEGFGFPVLDSLMHDTPVLSSFHSSLKEFDSPGVFFFDPYNPKSLDEAFIQMKSSSGNRIDRDALRDQFSWDKLAETVLELSA